MNTEDMRHCRVILHEHQKFFFSLFLISLFIALAVLVRRQERHSSCFQGIRALKQAFAAFGLKQAD